MHSNTRRQLRFSDKISIWIYPGSRAGWSLCFYPRRVLAGLGLCCLVVLAFYVARYGYQDQSVLEDPGQQLVSDETLKTLTEYLSRRAKLEGSLKAGEIRVDERMERRLQILADEYTRVRNYEQQLKDRASLLNSVLRDALKLSKDSPIIDLLDEGVAGDPTIDTGVGGGDYTHQQALGYYPELTAKVLGEKKAASSVLAMLDQQSAVISRIPLGVPVNGRKTSAFGKRISPFSRRKSQFHRGIDYAIDRNTRVVATADGVVVKSGWEGGLGKAVKIDHGNGIETVYGHLHRTLVEVGQKVCRGQTIGRVGNTGRSTGPHVHYEVLIGGIARDPEPYVQLASLLPFLKASK